METLRRQISNLISDKTASLVTSGIFCFTAGLLVSHWSRRLYSAVKARRINSGRSGFDATTNGSDYTEYDRRVASRSQLTSAERRLAKEAANELIRALEKCKQDVSLRDGSRIGGSGGETCTGTGKRDLYIRECDQRMYDKEDDDNTF